MNLQEAAMKKPIVSALCAIFLIAFSRASFCTEGSKMSVTVKNNAIDLTVGDKIFIGGLYPEVVEAQKVLSAADGALAAGTAAGPEAGSDELGAFENWNIPYGSGGKEVLIVNVRFRPGLSAAAVGFKYEGGKPLFMNGGLRLVFGGVPGFERGMGAERFSQFWTRPAFADSPGKLPAETQYIVWNDRNFTWGAAIPLVGGGLRTTFSPADGKLVAVAASFDSTFRPKGSPMAAFAWGADPYSATHNLYRTGMQFMGNPGKLREEKSYPEILNYIGWCSWNAYGQSVGQSFVETNAKSFKRHNFPIGFFIIDDGWQQENNRKLIGFDAIKAKFPHGVAGLVSKLKGKYGIRWVGFWHAYQGYWNGVDPNSALAAKYKDSLFQSYTGTLIPDPMDKRGFRFYNDYHSYLRAAGADFVKVDNQSTLSAITMNKLPIGYAAQGQQGNLQASLAANFNNTVVNCMDMTIENVYFWNTTNIGRNSDDYIPGRPDNPRIHAYHNIYNSMWFSELTWPDFDMWESHHPQARLHSVLRAVSGGPVYITDTTGRENWDMLWKLIFSDGRVARPDLPARPTRDTLTVDTLHQPVPLKAFNRAGGAGIVAAFNIYEKGGTVSGAMKPSDVEGFTGGPFAVYEHFSGDLKILDDADSQLPFTVDDMSALLFIVVPVKDGFAPIGMINKYISPKWVLGVERGAGTIAVELAEGGTFGAYAAEKPKSVSLNGNTLGNGEWRWANGLLAVEIPQSDQKARLEIAMR
jgi:raffinose synthase